MTRTEANRQDFLTGSTEEFDRHDPFGLDARNGWAEPVEPGEREITRARVALAKITEKARITSALMAWASTPGQVAAARFVLGLDERSQADNARALRISPPRFNQLVKKARARLRIEAGGLNG